MPKISVIIPAYNAEKYISECLNSVLSQDFDDFEVLCVNDGSTDKTEEIINSFNNPKVILINQKNIGASISRKNGLEKAKGDYILFVDSDDILEEHTLKLVYENAIKNKSDIVYFKYFEYDGKNKTPYIDSDYSRCFPKVKNFDDFVFKADDSPNAVLNKTCSLWSKLISHELFKKYDDWFFPSKKETIIEDLPIHCQLHLRADRITFCDKFLYSYRYSSEDSILHKLRSSRESLGIFYTVDFVEKVLTESKFIEKEDFLREFALFKISHLKVWFESIVDELKAEFFEKLKNSFAKLKVDLKMLKTVRYDNFIFYKTVVESSSLEDFQKKYSGIELYLKKIIFKFIQNFV